VIPRVVNAEFIKSAQALKDSIDDTVSEVVFLGRSNVGKSSTINGLTNRKNLAKSSTTPGKTQLINFFNIKYKYDNKDWTVRFVDLPGFGYAKVSKDLKNIWQRNLVEFIKYRVSIRIFIHLRDARHTNTQIDKDVEKYVSNFIRGDQLYLNIFTKIDKLNQKAKSALKRDYPNSIMISNLKKDNYDKIHQEIFKHIFGIEEWSN
jgi:GTP-binding protein